MAPGPLRGRNERELGTTAFSLRTPLLLAAGAMLVVLASAVHTSATLRPAASLGPAVTLAKDVPDLRLIQDAGALPAGKQVTVGILLSDSQRAAEESFYRQAYTPSSPLYHQFLTPAQFARRFGATSSQQASVRGWLTDGGLKVTYSGSAGRYWVATGTAADVNRLFQVQLHSYKTDGETAYANDRAPTVPSGLGVAHAFLTDAIRAQTHQPNPVLFANPSDLWSLYNAPSADTGQGEQLGLLGFLYNPSDPSLGVALKDFETANSLPQVPLRVIPSETGSFGATNTGAEGEWELDTQASSGMAPGAMDIDFYDAPSANLTDGTTGIAYWVGDPNGPRQASASWGACEDNPAFQAIGIGYADAMTAAELQGVDEGRTLFSSTGDTGSGCITPANVQPVLNPNGIYESPNTLQSMPAAIPWTVAVGGTVLYPDSADSTQRGLEYSWTHGGGGASRFQAAPDYQTGDANVNIPCVSDDTGDTTNTGVTCRGVPDVSIMSGDIFSDGYNISDRTGACSPAPCQVATGGTSLSSPLWLGVWARLEAAAAQNLGFANPTLYGIGDAADQTQYQRDFFDIIVGTNGAYHAAPGWDYTSGWGTPNITNLATDVTGNSTLTPTHPSSTLPPLPPPPGGGGSGGGGGGTGPPVSDAACTPLWTDPTGDDTFVENQTGVAGTDVDHGMNPQLDLLTSRFQLSSDQKTLRVQLTIDNLSKTVPAYSLGNIYWGTFTFNGTPYFVSAEVDSSGTVTYTWGTDSNGYSTTGDIDGSFGSGQNGIVEMDLPLADLGAGLGSALTNTGGETWAMTAAPSDIATTAGEPGLGGQGLLSPIDVSPQDATPSFTGRIYQVGEECTAPAGQLAALRPVEGHALSGTVATFTDKRTSDTAGEFAALIDWGDGSSSTGTVTGGNGTFTVTGSHTWTDEGASVVSVALQQTDDPHRPAGTAASTVTVADADALACRLPATIRGSVNFSGQLATCTDSDTATPATGLFAKVSWGDGSIVSYLPVTGSAGTFQVFGKHSYAKGGRYTITVQLVDPGGAVSKPQTTHLIVN